MLVWYRKHEGKRPAPRNPGQKRFTMRVLQPGAQGGDGLAAPPAGRRAPVARSMRAYQNTPSTKLPASMYARCIQRQSRSLHRVHADDHEGRRQKRHHRRQGAALEVGALRSWPTPFAPAACPKAGRAEDQMSTRSRKATLFVSLKHSQRRSSRSPQHKAAHMARYAADAAQHRRREALMPAKKR
jgi:hypothetical protein